MSLASRRQNGTSLTSTVVAVFPPLDLSAFVVVFPLLGSGPFVVVLPLPGSGAFVVVFHLLDSGPFVVVFPLLGSGVVVVVVVVPLLSGRLGWHSLGNDLALHDARIVARLLCNFSGNSCPFSASTACTQLGSWAS